jgi:hypothetical protein
MGHPVLVEQAVVVLALIKVTQELQALPTLAAEAGALVKQVVLAVQAVLVSLSLDMLTLIQPPHLQLAHQQ